MKKINIIICILILFILCPTTTLAHPGRTDSNGCHVCRTNCDKWGVPYGERHCHNGNKKSTTKKSTKKSTTKKASKKSTTSNTKNNVVKLSSNTNIKDIKVNDDKISINDNMTYNTSSDNINLNITASDSKSHVYYNKNIKLKEGKTKETIKVVAQDNTVKNYVLTINRLSDNTNIKVTVNGIRANFINNISSNIILPSYATNIDIEYELEDSHAKVNLDYDKTINTNYKKVNIEVISESGKKQNYELNIHKKEESINIIKLFKNFIFKYLKLQI